MKKRFTILIAAIAAILMMAQPMKAVGQKTDPTATFDWSSNGNMGSNTTGTVGQITLSVAKNGASNAPAVYSNTLRLYANRNTGNGCSATFTAANNYKISAIEITCSSGQSVLKYATDGGSTFSNLTPYL